MQKLTAPKTSMEERLALLRALGISRVLYRDDVTQARPLVRSQFGNDIATFGQVHVLAVSGAFPLFASTEKIDAVDGVTGVAAYAGLLHRPARGFDSFARRPGRLQGRVADRDRADSNPPQAGADSGRSDDLRGPGAHRPGAGEPSSTSPRVVDKASGVQVRTSLVEAGGIRRARFTMAPGAHSFLLLDGASHTVVLAIAGKSISTDRYVIARLTPQPINGSGFAFLPMPFAHYTIFNQNFDPVWAGYVKTGGQWHPVHNFMIDGFANAWEVPPDTPLIVVNTLQIRVGLRSLGAAAFRNIHLHVRSRTARAGVRRLLAPLWHPPEPTSREDSTGQNAS